MPFFWLSKVLTNLGQPLYFTMTHEQYITIETARLAKQAGFNWVVNSYLSYYGNCPDNPHWAVSVQQEYKDWNNYKYKHILEAYSAPTQSVLQRWLREVKKVIVEPIWHIRAQFYSCGIVMPEWQNWGDVTYTENGSTYKECFNTYEAALEAGLQECLSLLIEKE